MVPVILSDDCQKKDSFELFDRTPNMRHVIIDRSTDVRDVCAHHPTDMRHISILPKLSDYSFQLNEDMC